MADIAEVSLILGLNRCPALPRRCDSYRAFNEPKLSGTTPDCINANPKGFNLAFINSGWVAWV